MTKLRFIHQALVGLHVYAEGEEVEFEDDREAGRQIDRGVAVDADAPAEDVEPDAGDEPDPDSPGPSLAQAAPRRGRRASTAAA